MDQDLDELEEKIKDKAKRKKDQKISGRSVFKLREIIQAKAVSSDLSRVLSREVERKKKAKKDGNGDDSKTLAGDN